MKIPDQTSYIYRVAKSEIRVWPNGGSDDALRNIPFSGTFSGRFFEAGCLRALYFAKRALNPFDVLSVTMGSKDRGEILAETF
jgi:hypothetical protein